MKELKESPDPLDRILGSMAFGEHRVALTDAEQERLQHAELALDLLDEQNGNKRIVVAQLMSRPVNPLSRTAAYEACSDAQYLFGYITTFDYSFEMLLKKNRLERMIRQLISGDEAPDGNGDPDIPAVLVSHTVDFKALATLEKEHTAVLEYLRLENERRRPDDPKQLTFVLHNDYTKLGWEPEAWDSAHRVINEELIPMKLKEYKGG